MPKLVTKATTEMLENYCDLTDETLAKFECEGIYLKAETGADASGSHPKFQTFKSDNDHLLAVGFRPYHILNDDGTTIYEELSLAPDTEILWGLIPAAETNDVVRTLTEKMEEEITFCNNNTLEIILRGRKIRLTCEIDTDQVDKKMMNKMCGCGGAICTLCNCTRVEANDPNWVRESGLKIDRCMTDVLEMADAIFKPDGTLKKKNMKSDDRDGVSSVPMEKGGLNSNLTIPSVHASINSLGHTSQINWFFNARHSFPNDTPIQGMMGKEKRTKEQQKAVDDAKIESMNNANDPEG